MEIAPKLEDILQRGNDELMQMLVDAPGKTRGSQAAAGTILARLKALLFCIDLFRQDTGLRGEARVAKIDCHDGLKALH